MVRDSRKVKVVVLQLISQGHIEIGSQIFIQTTTDPNRLKQTFQDSESDPQKPLIWSLSLVVEQGHNRSTFDPTIKFTSLWLPEASSDPNLHNRLNCCLRRPATLKPRTLSTRRSGHSHTPQQKSPLLS